LYSLRRNYTTAEDPDSFKNIKLFAPTIGIRDFDGLSNTSDVTVSTEIDSFVSDSSPLQADKPGTSFVGGLGERFTRWLLGIQVPPKVELLAQELVMDSDLSVNLEEPYSSDVTVVSRRNHTRYITDLVDECKISIEGITVETKANRLVARRWLSKRMVSRGMRTHHIKTMLPIAVEMVFVLNEYEIIAHQLRYSKAILDRRDLQATKYTPRHRPSFFNWFGAKRSVPVVADG